MPRLSFSAADPETARLSESVLVQFSSEFSSLFGLIESRVFERSPVSAQASHFSPSRDEVESTRMDSSRVGRGNSLLSGFSESGEQSKSITLHGSAVSALTRDFSRFVNQAESIVFGVLDVSQLTSDFPLSANVRKSFLLSESKSSSPSVAFQTPWSANLDQPISSFEYPGDHMRFLWFGHCIGLFPVH
jgi:hypothetical protein